MSQSKYTSTKQKRKTTPFYISRAYDMNTTKQKQQAKKDITKQQDTKGVTTRYNWALIKKQFMLSDVATIQEYRKVMPLKYFP